MECGHVFEILNKCHGYICLACGHNVCVIFSIDLISVGDL